MPLFEGESLFQKTVQRNQPHCKQLLVICNEAHYFLAQDQLEACKTPYDFNVDFLLEPCGRNTAPAIALACLGLDPKQLVLVSPSDHQIENHQAYQQAIETAKTLAQQNQLVTFGIQPSYPETGFGYIEANGHDVLSFTEKPTETVAQSYLQQGHYLWNSGLFCFKAGVFLEELNKHAPKLYQACCEAYTHIKPTAHQGHQRIPNSAMHAIPADSIDYAVMEKSQRVKVVASNMGWRDLGSFEALSEVLPSDLQGNTHSNSISNTDSDSNTNHRQNRNQNKNTHPHPQSLLVNAHNNLILSEQHLVSLVDVDDLMVIDTADALLIARKGSGQKIKQVVELLKQRGSELPNSHQTTHRPWGTYTVLEIGEGYKIKRIVVQPGKSLSLQTHQHRSEHWIVVSGIASVTLGQQTSTVLANESTYIPIGEKHRLANHQATPLILIEAQVGNYISEEDIQRFTEY